MMNALLEFERIIESGIRVKPKQKPFIKIAEVR
jgi:hypothetical protein